MPDEKWFYEQKNAGGGWSPRSVESQPSTVSMDGFLRLKRQDGTVGARVRRVMRIDPELEHLSLAELSLVLPGEEP